jgi:hypothetical protein
MRFWTNLLFFLSVTFSFWSPAEGKKLPYEVFDYSFHALRNHRHDPSYIFEPHPSGERAIEPRRTTNAAFVQQRGIKGQMQTGRRLTAAIIDTCFHPEYTRDLKLKGLIHPAAFAEDLALDPDRLPLADIDIYALATRKSNLTWNLVFEGDPNRRQTMERELNDITREADDAERENTKRRSYMRSHSSICGSDSTHGSGVMDAFHLIAPEAQILPIDLIHSIYVRDGETDEQKFVHAVRTAIKHQVDVINLSRSFDNLGRESFDVLKEAMAHGIVVVTSAGNDACIHRYRIREKWDGSGVINGYAKKQQFFDEVQGRGLFFAGSLGYGPDGEERISEYSHLAEDDTDSRFVLAPGENLPIRASRSLAQGTSFAAPCVTGAYLLLKQHMLDKGYAYGSNDTLLDILHQSGRNHYYNQFGYSTSQEVFKSLNVDEAIRLADERFNPSSRPSGRYVQIPSRQTATFTGYKPFTPSSVVTPTPIVSPVPTFTPPPVVTPAARSLVSRPVRTTAPRVTPVRSIPIRRSPVPRSVVTRQPLRPTGIAKRQAPPQRAISRPAIVRRPVAIQRSIARVPATRNVSRPAIAPRRAVVIRQPILRQTAIAKRPVRPVAIARRPTVVRSASASPTLVRARPIAQRQARP